MIRTTLDDLAMTHEEALAMMAIEPVLRRLGLSLYCLRCQAEGRPDGVMGNNHPEATEWTVSCGCMVRRYRLRRRRPVVQ